MQLLNKGNVRKLFLVALYTNYAKLHITSFEVDNKDPQVSVHSADDKPKVKHISVLNHDYLG